ncbi:MAG: fumarate reductase subunit C [Lautropia sp.]|nr:fumarate reductase subunit C [Lautropia sp.]
MSRPQRVVPPLKPVKGYDRSMKGWYVHARRPYHFYLVRELTCIAVGYYALLVIYGLFQLHAGEEAFNAFLTCLRSPMAVIVHLVVAGLIAFHSVTWFMVMPKTMPFIFVGGKRLPAKTITAAGLGGFGAASVALLLAFLMTAP